MGIPVLILGKSGSGKSTSLRNFGRDEILLVNVSKKPLPFRGRFDDLVLSDDYGDIARAFKRNKRKIVVIDDAGYLITNMFMRGHSDKGAGNAIFTFYNDLADRFWKMIEYTKTLPNDVVVYFLMHEDVSELGEIKPKTIGKLLDEKVCIEGMFTVVLRCITQEGKHYFKTETDGRDVCKSPMGMFTETMIDNDLKAVDTAIREYWELDGTENIKQQLDDIIDTEE